MSEKITRRDFLKGAMAGTASVAAMGIFGNSVLSAQANAEAAEETEPVVQELDIPEVSAPEQTEYECDVLVVGGGFAGLFAALQAKEAGASVVLVDKGTPGYSGESGWASSHNYFSADFGDDEEAFVNEERYINEYSANLNWVRKWCDESKSVTDKCREIGILNQYAKGEDSGYWVDGVVQHDKLREYHLANIDNDRRAMFCQALTDADIPFVTHTMIMDVIENDGKIAGAIGLHVESGTIMTFKAKSVVLCTGTGSYKPAGYPTGADTFDGMYMGYMHGLPVTGLEFEDFHMSASYAPGNVLACNSWQYLENIWLCAPGGKAAPGLYKMVGNVAKSVILPVFDSAYGITPVPKDELTSGNSRGASQTGVEGDDRLGKQSSQVFKGDVFGAAPGMSAHYCAGVWCGADDVEGKTGIEGLWVAGDGTNGCMATGATKGAPAGWTSNLAGVQGKLAGAAAAAYAAGVEQAELPTDKVAELTAEIEAPLSVEKGYDPNWARDVLTSICGPFWVTIAKTEESLNQALTQVRWFRDTILPKLRATNGHDLRLCAEMKHKTLTAELKIIASLERKESRGYHFREDYPYRDDNYLYFITLTKGDDGSVEVGRADYDDEWKGDLTAAYEDRYASWRFPGEQEALGLPDIVFPESTGSWGK